MKMRMLGAPTGAAATGALSASTVCATGARLIMLPAPSAAPLCRNLRLLIMALSPSRIIHGTDQLWNLSLERQISRGRPDEHSAASGSGNPAVPLHRPVFQTTRRDVQSDRLRRARLQMNAVEAGQGPHGELHPRGPHAGRAEVDLRHLVASYRADIADGKAHIQAAIGSRFHRQAAIGEA